jgi:hypothetical protein
MEYEMRANHEDASGNESGDTDASSEGEQILNVQA